MASLHFFTHRYPGKRLITSALLLWGLALASSMSQAAEAASNPREFDIIVTGEDSAHGTIPRKSAIFRTVRQSLIRQANERGYTMWDETHRTMQWLSSDWEGVRSEEVVINIVQGIREPQIDLIIIFSFNRNISDEAGAPMLHAVLDAKVLRVGDGEHLASSTAAANWPLPASCNKSCELDFVAEDTQRLVQTMGSTLMERLGQALGYGGYPVNISSNTQDKAATLSTFTLAISKFKGQDLIIMEDYLSALPHYVEHDYLINIPTATELSLKTTASSGKLMSDLLRMINRTGLLGEVSRVGNTFFIENSMNTVQRQVGPPDGF